MWKYLCWITNTDFVLAALICALSVTWLNHRSIGSDIRMIQVLLFGLVYICLRLLLHTRAHKKFEEFIILVLACITLKESLIGLLQIYGREVSNHELFACTGSFSNPGPYGGFIAVCSSIIVGWLDSCYRSNIFNSNSLFKSEHILDLICLITSLISIILALIVLPATFSRAAILTITVSMTALLLSFEKVKIFVRRFWIILIPIILLLTILGYNYKRSSADGRMLINKISLQIISKNGIHGVGLGNYIGALGMGQEEFFSKEISIQNGNVIIDPSMEKECMTADIPEYAFNEILKIGVEAGPISMLLLIILFVISILNLIRSKSVFAYGLISLLVFSLFSYPLNFISFSLIFALCLAISAIKTESQKKPIIKHGMAFFCLSLIILCNLSKLKEYYNARKVWKETNYFFRTKEYGLVERYYSELMPYLNCDGLFLYEYGYSLYKLCEYEKSDSILKLSAGLSNNPIIYNAMGINYQSVGEYRKAEKMFIKAFILVPNRLYPLYLLAKLYYEEQDSEKFEIIKKSIYAFRPKIESSTTEAYRREIETMQIRTFK